VVEGCYFARQAEMDGRRSMMPFVLLLLFVIDGVLRFWGFGNIRPFDLFVWDGNSVGLGTIVVQNEEGRDFGRLFGDTE